MKDDYLWDDASDIDDKIGRVMGVFVAVVAIGIVGIAYVAVRWVIG